MARRARLHRQLGATFALGLLIHVASSALLPMAAAHVGPSDAVNNRYYKLTPMADRVRIVYTLFYGEGPGAELRRSIDKDKNGALSDREVNAFLGPLEKRLLAAVDISLEREDKAADVVPRWRELDVGFGGETRTEGGAFSVDLVGTLCLPRARIGTAYRLRFADSFVVDAPGETELSIDPAPGIAIHSSMLAGREAKLRGETWTGGAGPLQEGYELSFAIQSDESAGLDKTCQQSPDAARQQRSSLWGGIGLVTASGALVLVWMFRRRRRG